MLDVITKDIFARIAKEMFGRKDNLTFLLIGRTGVGKSSTINSLLGEEVAPVGKYEPTTMEIDAYQHKHGDLTYDIFDTPGLCDDLPEVGNDEVYLEKIKMHASKADSIWFVTKLDETRITSDEKRGIKLISEALGSECWDRSIIVFTRADKADDFEEDLQHRTKTIREEIGKYSENSASIPAVPVSNSNPILPNGEKWLPELFTQVFLRFRDDGALPFLESMKEDIGATKKHRDEKEKTRKEKEQPEERQEERIELSEEQKEKIRTSAFKRIMNGATTGASIGGKIGKSFGKVGEAIGTGLGAVIGGIGGWLFG
ncbi:GTPase [Aeromonas diversa]|uniref:GTPase n=1 Tax=Aeromonas diversa TaxID=502790 RepID=UPI0039A1085A